MSISARVQQNLGVRTAVVTEGTLAPEVAAVGNIAFNERDQATVQARAAGFVERLHVRATLDRVGKGQPLVDLYLPDWSLGNPQPVQGGVVIAVALAGVLINGFTAMLFISRQKTDLNVRGAYLHMAADAATSLGVAVAGVLFLFIGWLWLDPVVTLVLGVVIVAGSWGLLRASLKLALHAAPEAIDAAEVRDHLAQLGGVSEVHDLHIWGMSTTDNAMTAHLVCPSGHPGDEFLQLAAREVERKFSIHHVTLQVELGDTGKPCALAPSHIV